MKKSAALLHKQTRLVPWVCFVFLLAQNPVFAQKNNLPPVPDSLVYRLFDKKNNVRWVKRFNGRFDDVQTVEMALGFDGRICRGFLSFPKSRTRFQLDGVLNGADLSLQERDPKDDLSGYLRGKLENKRLRADWSNYNNTLGGKLELEEINPDQQTANANCGDNKWANRYAARWNGKRAELVLSRVNHGALFGYAWIESDNRSYLLKGEIGADGVYQLDSYLPNGKIAITLQGAMRYLQSTDCNWASATGDKREIKFSLQDNYLMNCFEYADYLSSFDALYPKTRSADCNKWLELQVNNWLTRCKNAVAARQEASVPANRYAYRGSAWTEVVCWTDMLFSGYLTFTDSWNEKPQGAAFNLNLETGKEITYNDLFNKGFDAKTWFDDFIKKETPKLPRFSADPQLREWLYRDGFPLFTLQREGMVFSTLFHPVYGRQHLIVPYTLIKPYMKKDNPITELVK